MLSIEWTGKELREFLEPDLPPVWHMGECLDNARASAFFRALADSLKKDIKTCLLRLQVPNGPMKRVSGGPWIQAFRYKLLSFGLSACSRF